ncbi:nitronate monooxygenase [Oligella ureolytica]
MGRLFIDDRLGDAFNGDLRKGLFFRGKDPLPFGHQKRSVYEYLALFINR